MLLEKDGGPEDRSHAVWLQTNFFVGSGDNKGSSFINIALGEWDPQTGITGARRGASIVLGSGEGSTPRPIASAATSRASAGPDGSHFLGSDNPNIVIGADSTGDGHNIFRDTPLNPTEDNASPENQSGATYHVGIGEARDDVPTQTSGTLNGFAAGFAQHPGSSGSDIVANFSPSDVTLNFNATTNTMTAAFKLKEVNPSALGNFRRREPEPTIPPWVRRGWLSGRSAFIDNNTFAAIEQSGGSTVSEQYLRTSDFRLRGARRYTQRIRRFRVSS